MHACRLTGVENESLDPRCDVDGFPVHFNFIPKPLQECRNVFCYGGFILCDVFGCKLRMSGHSLDTGYRGITAEENSFRFASL